MKSASINGWVSEHTANPLWTEALAADEVTLLKEMFNDPKFGRIHDIIVYKLCRLADPACTTDNALLGGRQFVGNLLMQLKATPYDSMVK